MQTVFIDLIYGVYIGTVKSNIINKLNEIMKRYLKNEAHLQNCDKIMMCTSKKYITRIYSAVYYNDDKETCILQIYQ